MLVSGPGIDRFLQDDGLSGQIEGDAIDQMLAWGCETARRALVVGLEDRGRIALELARRGVFVTVVEPDESLHEPVRAAAEAEHFMIRLNFYASDYMKREFASSGFDLAIFYSALSRYNEPLVVLKKAARELRAGGKVFARIRVRPAMGKIRGHVAPIIDKVTEKAVRVPGFVTARDRIINAIERLPLVSRFVGLPDAGDMLEDLAGVFKIERVEKRHLLAPVVGWAGIQEVVPVAARSLVRKAVPAVVKADQAMLRAAGDRLVATHLYVYGAKELGLGHTFRV